MTKGTKVKHSNGYKVWTQRLTSGQTLTSGQCGQFARSVGALAYGYSPGGHKTSVREDEARELLDLVRVMCPRIGGRSGTNNDAHLMDEERGRQWLAKVERKFDLPRMPWADIESFRFTDVHNYGSNGWRADIVPMFTAYWEGGLDWFSYAPTPWQRGLSRAEADGALWWARALPAVVG